VGVHSAPQTLREGREGFEVGMNGKERERGREEEEVQGGAVEGRGVVLPVDFTWGLDASDFCCAVRVVRDLSNIHVIIVWRIIY